jgi:hypothetical protein
MSHSPLSDFRTLVAYAARGLQPFENKTMLRSAALVQTSTKGYFLKTSRDGPAAQTTVMSCQEAVKYGLKCRLTDDGSVSAPASRQVFLDALKQNGVNSKRRLYVCWQTDGISISALTNGCAQGWCYAADHIAYP